MRAVVLVGGFGTRLRPLTNVTPKQMLPILHRPMIEHVVEQLGGHGVEEAVLSMGYRPDAFLDVYPDGLCAGVKLHYAVEPEPLDTAGAIRFAARNAGIVDRFVVVNGDILTDMDLRALVRFHDERGAEATIALHRVDDPSAFGVVPTDADGRVVAFVEKPSRADAPTDLINAGTYVLEPTVLDRIPEGRKVSIERETFPAMVADDVLFALADDSYWIDTGTPTQYIQAQLDLLDGGRAGRPRSVMAGQGISPAADVDATALDRPGRRGRRCVRATGGDGSAVGRPRRGLGGENATVEDSVVGPGASVGVGAVVEHWSVIGAGESVADGERLSGIRRP